MKTKSDLLNIFLCDTSRYPTSGVTLQLFTLTTEEIQRLIQVVVNQHQIYTLESIVGDYLLQALQILSDRQISECTTDVLTIEQLEIYGVPSGQCDIFGNDLY